MNGCGHEDCQRTSAYPTVCLHTQTYSMGSVAAAEAVAHRHRWIYDGQTTVGVLVYHCDDHDPPVVRQVWPGVTL